MSPQLASEFVSRFVIFKGQGQTSNKRMWGASVPFPLSGLSCPGRCTPGAKDWGIGQKACHKCTLMPLLTTLYQNASLTCTGILLSVSMWTCTWTEAAGPAPLPVWILLFSGSPGHSSENLQNAVLCLIRGDHPTLHEGALGKAKESGSLAKMKSGHLQGTKWPLLHTGL